MKTLELKTKTDHFGIESASIYTVCEDGRAITNYFDYDKALHHMFGLYKNASNLIIKGKYISFEKRWDNGNVNTYTLIEQSVRV